MLYIFQTPKKEYTFRFDFPKVTVINNKLEKQLKIESDGFVTLEYHTYSVPTINFGQETKQLIFLENELSDNDLKVLTKFSNSCGFEVIIVHRKNNI